MRRFENLKINWSLVIAFVANLLIGTLAKAQLREIPYNSDSTFYRADLAIKNSDRCYYLFLEADSLNSLPSNFTSLKHLKGITLRHCPVVKWDEMLRQLSQLPSLEYLEISVNEIKSLPSNISDLKNLQSLNLKSNALTELPSSLPQCTKLQFLNLSFERGLKWDEVFDLLSRIPSIEILDLSSNSITSLPENFSSLVSVKEV